MVAGPFAFNLCPMKHLATLAVLLFAVGAATAADTIYVHPNAELGGDGRSWNAPYRTLTIAMADAQAGDEIWMAKGTYRLGATLNMKNGVRIYGGFNGDEQLRERRDWYRNPTIIESAGGVETLVSMKDVDSTSRLDGLVLQGALLSAVVVEGGAPVFFNCHFRDNQSISGGAIRATGVSRMRIEFCTFTNNHAETSGGAIDISSVSKDPAYAWGPFIGESLFDKNTSSIEGGAISFSECASIPQLASNVFTENKANLGGAVSTARTYIYITNCTFFKNTLEVVGPLGGRTLFVNGGHVQNSVIWGGNPADNSRHVADVDVPNDTTKLTTLACLIEADFDLGFWQSNPQFEDENNVLGIDGFFGTDDDGLRLSSFSPVRDGGVIDGFVNHQNCDAIGNPRLVGRKIDLGAYESQRNGRMGYREVMKELRTGKMVMFFRHAKTDWGQQDPGPSPECFPGRNLIWEGREQSREIGKHWTSLGVPIGDAFSSPFCRCWETALLMVGRYEKKNHWASGGTASDSARWADLETIPTNGNRFMISHDAVANYLFNPAGDGSVLTTAEIMEGDCVIFRPTGDTIEVLAQWCSDTWERYYVRFPETTSMPDGPCVGESPIGIHATPLPATDHLSIMVEGGEAVRVVDVMGRTIVELPASVTHTVDVSAWPSGLYHLVGVTSGRSTTAVISR